ncbi:hypothetical protein B0H10DRAFT_2220444 [Mycena sp. CBHHK59/15]|nr:hypothetical protein B0H10DRAFT_2229136 [Mycena sp. CBHHK59/15]KAJ6615423.1 hypothetical protein B0H10DRAFT_2220444 [Mycena sp. CBHHK59/15]
MASNTCRALILYQDPSSLLLWKSPAKPSSMQTGEPYSSSAFEYFQPGFSLTHPPLVVTYDVCCQYRKDLYERQQRLHLS